MALAVRARRPEAPEDRVRAVLDDVIDAAEERSLGDVLEHVAPGYLDGDGLDRDGLKVFLFYHFRSVRALRVHRLGPVDVEIKKDGTAVSRFRAVLSEGLSLESLRNAGTWDFEVELALDVDEEWRVTAHQRWRR